MADESLLAVVDSILTLLSTNRSCNEGLSIEQTEAEDREASTSPMKASLLKSLMCELPPKSYGFNVTDPL